MKGMFFAGLAMGALMGSIICEMKPEIAQESKGIIKKLKSKMK